MTTPFDYINSVSFNKEDLSQNDDFSKGYVPFIVNRGLSYFKDTVFLANEMNMLSNLPLEMQYTFYLNIIRPKKRFSKWSKRDKSDAVVLLSKRLGLNYKKAQAALNVLTDDEVDHIKELSDEGSIERVK